MSFAMTSDRHQYSSPRAVVDMRLLEYDEAKLLHELRTPQSLSLSMVYSSASHAGASPMTAPLACSGIDDDEGDEDNCSSELLPPMRCLSVSTRSSSVASSNADDDLSSVSSVSLDDGFLLDTLDSDNSGTAAPQTPPVKRTIFGNYWDKKGGKPTQPLLPVTPEAKAIDVASTLPCNTLSNQDSYEKLLECTEAPVPLTRPTGSAAMNDAGNATSPKRRQLWDNRYVVCHFESSPALYQDASLFEASETLRKTQSTPVVGRTPSLPNAAEKRPSCLRQCRFSSNMSTSNHSQQQQRRSSDTTVVSFSDRVQVKYVKVNTENFAAPGWSKHFM
jgi:hypothetical protein